MSSANTATIAATPPAAQPTSTHALEPIPRLLRPVRRNGWGEEAEPAQSLNSDPFVITKDTGTRSVVAENIVEEGTTSAYVATSSPSGVLHFFVNRC